MMEEKRSALIHKLSLVIQRKKYYEDLYLEVEAFSLLEEKIKAELKNL